MLILYQTAFTFNLFFVFFFNVILESCYVTAPLASLDYNNNHRLIPQVSSPACILLQISDKISVGWATNHFQQLHQSSKCELPVQPTPLGEFPCEVTEILNYFLFFPSTTVH